MDKYEGPLEPGMVMTGPDNDGVLGFRRDLLLARHPNKPDLWIYEALPCRMRRAQGSGVGQVGVCPEINLRIVMRPEVEPDTEK
jgi:hypothetical protein